MTDSPQHDVPPSGDPGPAEPPTTEQQAGPATASRGRLAAARDRVAAMPRGARVGAAALLAVVLLLLAGTAGFALADGGDGNGHGDRHGSGRGDDDRGDRHDRGGRDSDNDSDDGTTESPSATPSATATPS